MFERNSEDFLWYVNFGITKTQAQMKPEEALKHCINNAYKDACRHVKYYYSIAKLEAMQKKSSSESDRQTAKDFYSLKEDFKLKCSSIIRNYIMNLLSSDKIDFDEWHKELCTGENAVDPCLDDVPEGLFQDDSIGLTVGQRQKWVNMSIKNMLVMGLWDKDLERNIDKIHVPIDDKIQRAAKSVNVHTVLPAWNNINDYEDYMRFQSELRDKLGEPPIIWEWDSWLT